MLKTYGFIEPEVKLILTKAQIEVKAVVQYKKKKDQGPII